MTLKEWYNLNKDKEIEYEDGAIKVKEDTIFRPKKDEGYFFINGGGFIASVHWCNSGYDWQRLAIGNVFRTEKEVKDTIKRLSFRRRLEILGARFKRTEDGWGLHAGIGYDSSFEFPSEEARSKAEDELGKENIEAFILGTYPPETEEK